MPTVPTVANRDDVALVANGTNVADIADASPLFATKLEPSR